MDTYVRDQVNPKAVLNTDVEGFKQYKLKKAQTMRVEELQKEVISLRDDMTEIKDLLQALVRQE
jgi:hypothetical protein